MMMPWFGWGGYGTFGLIGMILNLIITVALIAGIAILAIWVVRRLSTGGREEATPEAPAQISPRELLKIRYARGEITREQYLQMLDDLS